MFSTQTEVLVQVDDYSVDISIIDDGIGIDLLNVSKLGLVNLEQRVNNFGGLLQIVTKSGGGITIQVRSIPLQRRHIAL